MHRLRFNPTNSPSVAFGASTVSTLHFKYAIELNSQLVQIDAMLSTK
jgi:hypothetical protein